MYGHTDMRDAFRIHTLYTAFSEQIDPDYFFAGERHDFWELVFVAQGEVGVTAGEEAGVLRQGQAILHSPMEFHRIWYAGSRSGQIIVFSFGADGMPPVTSGFFPIGDPGMPAVLLEELKRTFVLEGINITGVKASSVEAQLLLKRLELFILETVSPTGQQRNPGRSRSAENYAQLVRFLEENIHRNLSVDEIARGCSMSPINAKQTFSRYAGLGIRTYFNRLKVEAAIAMLRSGTSVQETAAALGFSSQNYFCTVFKRITGAPPSTYK